MEFDLTLRERQILRLICDNKTNGAIAIELGISLKTVEKHRTNLNAITGSNSAVGLVRYALKHQVVNAQEWVSRPSDVPPRQRRTYGPTPPKRQLAGVCG